MFKIVRLSLYGMEEGQAFSYQFSDGINYFQGKMIRERQNFTHFWIICLAPALNCPTKIGIKTRLNLRNLTLCIMTTNLLSHVFYLIKTKIIFVITMMTPQKKFALMNIELS